MAAQNMCNIVQGYLLKRERPEYLQPKSVDGTYLWATSISKATEPSVLSHKRITNDSELEEQAEELSVEPKKQRRT